MSNDAPLRHTHELGPHDFLPSINPFNADLKAAIFAEAEKTCTFLGYKSLTDGIIALSAFRTDEMAASLGIRPPTPSNNLEGLRDKLLTPVIIERTQDGHWHNPAVPVCDEGTNMAAFYDAFRIEATWVSMEYDDKAFHTRYVEEALSDISSWVPTPPKGDGWLLSSIYDTEEGPYAEFIRAAISLESDRARSRRLRRDTVTDVLFRAFTGADNETGHDLMVAPLKSPGEIADDFFRGIAYASSDFQGRVNRWMQKCFDSVIAADKVERNHRFLEESLELVQACGCSASEAHQLVDYVFGRSVGKPRQEIGGVMVTLAALCLASGEDMHVSGERELARISNPATMAKIRAKQAAKPKHSPLPEVVKPAVPAVPDRITLRINAAINRVSRGDAPMRIPVDDTDVDVVLAECQTFFSQLDSPIEGKPETLWKVREGGVVRYTTSRQEAINATAKGFAVTPFKEA